jgi:hypothetical protein
VEQRKRWEDDIEKNVIEMLCGDIEWIHVSRDKAQWWAVTNTVTKIRVS